MPGVGVGGHGGVEGVVVWRLDLVDAVLITIQSRDHMIPCVLNTEELTIHNVLQNSITPKLRRKGNEAKYHA